jgi:hypothetical protein
LKSNNISLDQAWQQIQSRHPGAGRGESVAGTMIRAPP